MLECGDPVPSYETRLPSVPERMVRWVVSFMTDRTVKLRFDNEEGEWHPIETGIPQGSPVSPILFNLYIAPLIKLLEETADEEDRVVPVFIDDVTIAAKAESWQEAMEKIEKMFEKAYVWAKENDVRFEEEKFEWMRMWCTEEVEEMELPGRVVKKESEIVRWLGVWLDRQMKMKKHVEIKAEKGRKIANMLSRAGGRGKGMGVGNMQMVFKACGRTVMEYGGLVWWKGQKGMEEQIDQVNRKAMRQSGGHYRDAPSGAVMLESNTPPTGIRMAQKQQKRAVKTLTRNTRHPTRKHMDKIVEERIDNASDKLYGEKRKEKREGEKDEILRRGMGSWEIKNMKQWKKIEKVEFKDAKKKEWEEEVIRTLRLIEEEGSEAEYERQRQSRKEQDEVVMFSDGSKLQEHVGVGVYRAGKGGLGQIAKSFRMGRKMEVWDAEMVGIRKAVEIGMQECVREGKKKLRVRCDCQEAMRRVFRKEESKGERMAHRIRWMVDACQQRDIQVTLEWVHGHCGVRGNEKADQLAKAGAVSGTEDKEAFTSIAFLERQVKGTAIASWGKVWEFNTVRGKYYAGHPKNNRPSTPYPKDNRTEQVILSRLRTGHISCNAYLHRIGKIDDPKCHCGAPKQTVPHVLLHCPTLDEMRHQMREEMREMKEVTMLKLLYDKKGMKWGVELWKKFVQRRSEVGEKIREAREGGFGWGDLES